MRSLWTPRETVKRFDQKGQRRYIYRPGLDDRCFPNVVAGRPIEPDSIVVVTWRIGRALCWILDAEGNKQSVWFRALVPYTYKERHGKESLR